MTAVDVERVVERVTEEAPRQRPRPRMARALKIDFWLDLVLLIGLVAAETFHLTGLVLHEWIGVVLAVAILAHITLHWNWVVRTTSRLLKKSPGRESIRWLNNIVLMLAMTLVIASGLFSSRFVLPTFGIAEGSEDFWHQVHFWCADILLVSGALHVALNWRWIITTTKRIAGRGHRRQATPRSNAS